MISGCEVRWKVEGRRGATIGVRRRAEGVRPKAEGVGRKGCCLLICDCL